jgi:hypothetical protein
MADIHVRLNVRLAKLWHDNDLAKVISIRRFMQSSYPGGFPSVSFRNRLQTFLA